MDIKELKNNVEQNTLSDDILIFKYSKDKFLCEHYINNIAKNKKLELLYIDSLDEIPNDDFFDAANSTYLYIYETDTLLEADPDLKNVIILCQKVSKEINIDYIEFPEIKEWQIEDFLKYRLPGLSMDQIKWLCEICKYNYYRLDNEAKKIEIFDKTMQPIIFNQMSEEGAFSDLNNLNIMNLITAIMQKDFITINNILSDLRNIDIEGTGLVTLGIKQFKSNIEVLSNNVWNPSMDCTEKQFRYLKWKPNNNYTLDQMINIYEFLVSQDEKLKQGKLTFKAENRPNNNSYVDYIVENILILGSN